MLQSAVKGELKSSIMSDKEIKEVITYTDNNGNPTIHVVSFKPEGFILISGIRKEVPILALSETGNFNLDEKNLALKQWFKGRADKIKWLRSDTSTVVPDDIETQWQGILPPPGEEETEPGPTYNIIIGPLMSTEWGQGDGYNEDCPLFNCSNTPIRTNGRAYAGCVAVAQSQVMKYWEHPNSYDFNLMADNFGGAETSELISDVGLSLTSAYGCSVTWAMTSDCPSSLVSFGYSNLCDYVSYDYEQLVDQIDNGWPVILAGTDANYGGHSWVCDGYRRYKLTTIHNPGTLNEYITYEYTPPYFYMNWGGNGDNNGWYYYNKFTPSFLSFYDIEMVINIHP